MLQAPKIRFEISFFFSKKIVENIFKNANLGVSNYMFGFHKNQ